jgi:hypothetical protein
MSPAIAGGRASLLLGRIEARWLIAADVPN